MLSPDFVKFEGLLPLAVLRIRENTRCKAIARSQCMLTNLDSHGEGVAAFVSAMKIHHTCPESREHLTGTCLEFGALFA